MASSSFCCFCLSNPSARLFTSLLLLTAAAWITSFILTRTILEDDIALGNIADEWLLVGGVTESSVSFRIQVASTPGDAISRTLVLSPSTGGVAIERSLTPMVDQPNAELLPRLYAISISDLQPQTKYGYYLTTGGTQSSLAGSFQTPAPPNTRFNFTVLASGCAWTGSQADIFDVMNTDHAKDSLMMLHLGDFHYQDLNTNNVATRVNAISNVLASRPQAELYRSLPLVSMWDDHDYLGNNAMGFDEQEAGARDAALDSYQYAFPHYPLAGEQGDNNTPTNSSLQQRQLEQQNRPGIYQAFTIGTVRFVMSDVRSETTPGNIMSPEQKEWLTIELQNADQYDMVVWITSKPWIGDAEPGEDSWMGMPEERAEMSGLISTLVGEGPRNLVALSSDMHAVALDDGSHTYYGSSENISSVYSFPMVQLGSLDRMGSAKGGPFITGCKAIEYERTHQFAILEFTFEDVDGSGEELPCLRISTFRVNPKIWGLSAPGDQKQLLFSYRFCGILFTPVGKTPGRTCEIERLSTTGWGLAVSGLLMTLVVSIGAAVLPQTASWKTKLLAGSSTFLLVWISFVGTVAIGLALPYLTRGVAQYNLQESFALGLLVIIAMGLWVVLSAFFCAGCDRVPVTTISSPKSTAADDKGPNDNGDLQNCIASDPVPEVTTGPSNQTADAEQRNDGSPPKDPDLEVANVDNDADMDTPNDAGPERAQADIYGGVEETTRVEEIQMSDSVGNVEVTEDHHGSVVSKSSGQQT